MNLYQEFLIIAGIICGLAGCASTSDEMATATKAASVQSSEVTNSNSICLLYTSPSPRDATLSRMPSSA